MVRAHLSSAVRKLCETELRGSVNLFPSLLDLRGFVQLPRRNAHTSTSHTNHNRSLLHDAGHLSVKSVRLLHSEESLEVKALVRFRYHFLLG